MLHRIRYGSQPHDDECVVAMAATGSTTPRRPSWTWTAGSQVAPRVLLGVAVVISGLALRAFGRSLGLPAVVVKYGGSILWATMVFLIVAVFMRNKGLREATVIAFLIAVSVECFRLYHAPWLDAFRLTLPGALLLGRLFSPWDIAAYAMGVLLGLALEGSLGRPMR